MKTHPLFSAAVSTAVAALLSGLSLLAAAQEPVPEQDPFAAAPFTNPQPLEALLALDDGEFLRRLFAASGGTSLFDRLLPAGATVFPMSHGFAGARDACARMRTVQACRLYLHDLIMINEEKLRQHRVLSNPFAPAK